jgi:hypothetical protein
VTSMQNLFSDLARRAAEPNAAQVGPSGAAHSRNAVTALATARVEVERTALARLMV